MPVTVRHDTANPLDMEGRSAFLILVLAQSAHSVEEYVFGLYDVFAPARIVSSLFSDDLRAGFVIANSLVITFGFWCYLAQVRPARPSARTFMWGWAIVEAANGTVHLLIAAAGGEYFPGVYTAPVLLAVSLFLGLRLRRAPPPVAGSSSIEVRE